MSTSNKGTDEAFHQMMQLSGSALLKLLGFADQTAESYAFRAVEFKQKRVQRPDIEAIPVLESADTRALIEFQGYADKWIRLRALRNMVEACEQEMTRDKASTTDLEAKEDTQNQPKKPRKRIIGIIIYTDSVYQKAALPLADVMPDMQAIPMREFVLIRYTEATLLQIDPRLILLAPFTVPKDIDKAELQQKHTAWTKQIYAIYTTPEQQAKALNILALLSLDRFRHLNDEEIISMLNIDLMQSRAVQEVFRKGLLEGEQKGLLKGKQAGLLEGKQAGLREGEQKKVQEAQRKVLNKLQKRFGTVPSQAEVAVQRLETLDEVMEAFEVACFCEQIEEFIDSLK